MSSQDKTADYIRSHFAYPVNDHGFTLSEKWEEEEGVKLEKEQVVVTTKRYWDNIVLVYVGIRDSSSSAIRKSYDLNNIVWYHLYEQGIPSAAMRRIYSYLAGELEDAVRLVSELVRQYAGPLLRGDISMENEPAGFERKVMEEELRSCG